MKPQELIHLTVEFTGVAREIVGAATIELSFPKESTYTDVVRELGKQVPGLVGILIDQDGETFLSSNMFIINNEMSLPVMIMDEQPKDGDRLVLVSVMTGG